MFDNVMLAIIWRTRCLANTILVMISISNQCPLDEVLVVLEMLYHNMFFSDGMNWKYIVFFLGDLIKMVSKWYLVMVWWQHWATSHYLIQCWPRPYLWHHNAPWIILYLRPANERRRYIVTSALIGWVHAQMIPAAPRYVNYIKGFS